MKRITSTDNQQIKQAAKLHKARERKKQGKFLIEGKREIQAAQKNNVEIETLFVCPELSENYEDVLDGEVQTIEVSPSVYKKLVYRDEGGDGLVAVARTYEYTLEMICSVEKGTILVLDNVEKPGNLGALIRTSVAADVAAIIVNDMQTDIFNPNVIRASLGGIFELPVIEANREDTRHVLAHNTIPTYVTSAQTHDRKSYVYWDIAYPQTPVAFVLGSEGRGVSQFWITKGDALVYIPMSHDIVSSLNVSVSGAIFIYEVFRQRTQTN